MKGWQHYYGNFHTKIDCYKSHGTKSHAVIPLSVLFYASHSTGQKCMQTIQAGVTQTRAVVWPLVIHCELCTHVHRHRHSQTDRQRWYFYVSREVVLTADSWSLFTEHLHDLHCCCCCCWWWWWWCSMPSLVSHNCNIFHHSHSTMIKLEQNLINSY